MIFCKNTKASTFLSFGLICLGFSASANAQSDWVKNAKITATLADSAYGGCMVLLDKKIADPEKGTLSSCPSRWLSLDCDSIHHTPAQSNAMWTSALVAFSLQKTVNFYVLEDVKFNGYCMARRIDVVR